MILDTCAVLWLAEGSRDLTEGTVERIRQTPVVYLCAISGFEIAIKVAKRKLELPLPPHDWFVKTIEHHDLTVLFLDLDLCISSAELPRVHSDPCDRLIIAAAKRDNLTVVTADPRFVKYGVTVII